MKKNLLITIGITIILIGVGVFLYLHFTSFKRRLVRIALNELHKWRSITELESEDYYAESTRQRAPRQIRITFTYRLNQMKKRDRGGDRDNSGEEGFDEF